VLYVGVKQSAQLNVDGNSTSTTTTAEASTGFFQFSQAQLTSQFSSLNTEPTLGNCVTGTVAETDSGSGAPVATYLSGPGVLIPPFGEPIVLYFGQPPISQSNNLTQALPYGNWFLSGLIGPPSFAFQVPAPVTWINEVNLSTGPPIDRTQPLVIAWSGGNEYGYVDIRGQAQIGPAGPQYPTFSAYFDCAAPISAGQFQINPATLLVMPTGANANASIQVSTYAFPDSAEALVAGFDGFDVVSNNSEFQVSAPVIFK
jgi:hypothetical protein